MSIFYTDASTTNAGQNKKLANGKLTQRHALLIPKVHEGWIKAGRPVIKWVGRQGNLAGLYIEYTFS